MPLTPLSLTGKRMLLGAGSLVLGGGCLVLLFKAGVGFLLLWLAAGYRSDNTAPANQLTVVQGTVTNAETNQPIPGMLLAVRSQPGNSSDQVADSARTDARGRYRLRFRNQKGLYYHVSVVYPASGMSAPPTRYWFANPDDTVSSRDLRLGRLNTCNFRPGERHTIAVRVHNRNTGYRFLQLPDGEELPLNNRDTTLHLTFYALPASGIKLNYLKNSGGESHVGDTAVALVLQNPAARFPDTIRATLTFVR
ncbi:MAG: carboxypeptidase-like regulatory domain-containing protein [Janthinobacterium lividum]